MPFDFQEEEFVSLLFVSFLSLFFFFPSSASIISVGPIYKFLPLLEGKRSRATKAQPHMGRVLTVHVGPTHL